MDERVIDVPTALRWLIVYCLILPRRPKNSAEAYKRIWAPEGSPLIITSRSLQQALQKEFEFPIGLAMRYGSPSTGEELQVLADQGVDELFVFPLYPHYAMSSYETAVEKVAGEIERQQLSIKVTVVEPYYADPGYIDALVASAEPYLAKGFDRLVISFHGIPERHLRKSDPSGQHCLNSKNCCETEHPAHQTCYRYQCLQTARLFAEKANIAPDRYEIAFQSRLGRDPWLTPYTDQTLESLGKKGVGRLLIICPAFVADCLETLEEIEMEGKEIFLDAGGGHFEMIPCLNTHPQWVNYVSSRIQSWSLSSDASPASL